MATRREEVRVTADISNFQTKMAAAGASASAFASRLEEADGRMSNLVQTGLALAPALVPLGAAAVPAVAGLATQLGFAGLAAGTAVLAFKGVGTALDALNKYQLDPSAANLKALQLAMDKIGPAAQEFVVALDKMQPALQSLQNLAGEGLFPGATEGLNSLMKLLPQVQSIIFTTASTMGDLAAEAGKNLAGPKFTEFFQYLNTTARPILTDMGRTLGNFIEGIAHMVTAFDPLSQSFSKGFLSMSRSFAEWADGLSQSQGFQQFVDYVQSSGPRAMDALGSIADALIQLGQAAAPVGSLVLPVISALADGLAAIADSPVGPLLIGTAAAVGTLGRSLAILKTVGLVGGGESVVGRALGVDAIKTVPSAYRAAAAAQRELTAATEAQAVAARRAGTAQFALIPTSEKRGAVGEYIASQRQVAAASAKVQEAEARKSAALREGAASAGKAGAAALGLAVATSGLGDKMGLSNTASLAMMGTLAGPWGAAVGGGVGLVMDLAAANNDLETAMHAAAQAAAGSTVNFTDQGAKVSALQKQQEDYAQSTSFMSDDLGKNFNAIADAFTHTGAESEAATRKQTNAYMTLRQGAAEVYADLNRGNTSLITASNATADAFVNRITPALQDAGISVREFLSAADGSQLRTEGLKAIQSFFDNMSSASGKSKAVGQALADIGHEATAAADPVSALSAALDSLFGTEISQSAATDAWAQAIDDLGKKLKATNGQIQGQTQVARDNRGAIRDAVSALQAKVNADAAAGVSGDKLAGSLVRGREALINAGVAAGTSRKQMVAYVNSLGLAPKNIETIITTPGLVDATNKVKALGKLYGLTPKQIHTLVQQSGAEGSRAKVKALIDTLNLTPKQKHTLLAATDAASAKAKKAQAAAEAFAKSYQAYLDSKDGSTAKVRSAESAAVKFARAYLATLSANDRASGPARAAIALLNAFNGRTATATMTTIHRDIRVGSPGGRAANPTLNADGGIYTYADGGYTDRGQFVPRVSQMRRGGGNILWAEPETGWEAYISGKPGQRERNLDIWRKAGDRLGARFMEYAQGGITAYATGGDAGKKPKRPPKLSEDERKLIATLQEAARRGILNRAAVARVVNQIKRTGSTRGLGDELNGFIHQIDETFIRGKIPKALQDRLVQAVISGGGHQSRKDEVAVNRADRRQEAAKERRQQAEEDRKQKTLDAAHEKQQKIIDGLNDSLQENQSKLDAETQARQSLIDTIAGAYTRNPFGGGLSGFDRTVASDTARVQQVNADFQALIAKGLDGQLLTDLSSSGNDRLVHQFAQLSAEELNQREQAYNNRNALATIAGQTVANQQYNASIQTLTVEVQKLTDAVARATAVDQAINEQNAARYLQTGQVGGSIPRVAVNFNGPVTSKDVNALATKITKNISTSARLLRFR